jgi:hypothetical protein
MPKHLIRPLQGNIFLNDTMPRTKSEDSCPKDKLLDGGTRGKDKKRTGHREVRQYLTDFYLPLLLSCVKLLDLYSI